MPRTGRPKVKINWKLVENMLMIQCTQKEIAGVLEISHDTLERACKRDHKLDWSTYSEMHLSKGHTSLRRSIWLKAVEGGNTTMLIFLAKAYLGLRDGYTGNTTVAVNENGQSKEVVIYETQFSTPFETEDA